MFVIFIHTNVSIFYSMSKFKIFEFNLHIFYKELSVVESLTVQTRDRSFASTLFMFSSHFQEKYDE